MRRTMSPLGSNGVKACKTGCTSCGCSPHKFSSYTGQVGQESNLQPAVLETQSGVSGGVGHHRQMPLCPTLSVVLCRRMSPCVGGHWGRYWGSRCFRGRSSPCSAYPIRSRTHLTYGLIQRLFLAEPVRSASVFSASHGGASSQVYAPPPVPLCSVVFFSLAGGDQAGGVSVFPSDPAAIQ